MLARRLQRIRIKECLAVERHAGDETVVERSLHNIDVFRVCMKQEQALIPKVVADCGTGLVVSAHVRQLVWTTEGFARSRGPDATCDVKLFIGNVFPDLVDRIDVGQIAG